MRATPRASTMVMTTGSPSGMARRRAPRRPGTSRRLVVQRDADAEDRRRDRDDGGAEHAGEAVEALPGAGPVAVAVSRTEEAMRPRAESVPVAVTTPAPRPPTTIVPVKAMLRRSPSTRSGSASAAGPLGCGDRLAGQGRPRRCAARPSRAGAGRRGRARPEASSTTSPGTSTRSSRRRFRGRRGARGRAGRASSRVPARCARRGTPGRSR